MTAVTWTSVGFAAFRASVRAQPRDAQIDRRQFNRRDLGAEVARPRPRGVRAAETTRDRSSSTDARTRHDLAPLNPFAPQA